MFAITPDAIFKVKSYAYTAVSTSSAACGLGIACDVWFLVRYTWVELENFIVRSCRIPQPLHLMLLLTAPISRRIWFIRPLLFVLTHAHLLCSGVLHIVHRIRWMVLGCPGDHGFRDSGDVPPIYCVLYAWVTSALQIWRVMADSTLNAVRGF